MKKILFICTFLGMISVGYGQIFNIGVKGGLNYNTNGDLLGTLRENTSDDYITRTSNGDYGYHFGAFAEMKLPLFLYIRPEVVFTHTESYYEVVPGSESQLSINKMDFPLLVGFRLVKVLRLFIGPSFQYIIDNDFKNAINVQSDDFSMGMQIGAGLEFGRFGFDVRWEKGLSTSEATFTRNIAGDNFDVIVDTRPSQIIFGVYYKFIKKR